MTNFSKDHSSNEMIRKRLPLAKQRLPLVLNTNIAPSETMMWDWQPELERHIESKVEQASNNFALIFVSISRRLICILRFLQFQWNCSIVVVITE